MEKLNNLSIIFSHAIHLKGPGKAHKYYSPAQAVLRVVKSGHQNKRQQMNLEPIAIEDCLLDLEALQEAGFIVPSCITGEELPEDWVETKNKNLCNRNLYAIGYKVFYNITNILV